MKFFLNDSARAIALVVALGSPLPAVALEWDVGVGGDAYWFDWREYRDGEQLLVESGPLLLGRVDMRVEAADFYTSLALSWGGGQVEYDGQLQNGTPYKSDAWEEVVETELRVGVQRSWGSLHLGWMQRYWDRQIEGSATVSSVREEYRWRLLLVGGERLISQSGEWDTALAVQLGVPMNSWQKVHSGFFGDFNLEPGHGYYWSLALPLRKGAWEFSPFLQRHTMAESDEVKRTGADGGLYNIVQPESTRLEAGLRLRYAWGTRSVAASALTLAP
jgi:hypothetical protein